jgi:hypothetical protein
MARQNRGMLASARPGEAKRGAADLLRMPLLQSTQRSNQITIAPLVAVPNPSPIPSCYSLADGALSTSATP